jgi:hypothetical protein
VVAEGKGDCSRYAGRFDEGADDDGMLGPAAPVPLLFSPDGDCRDDWAILGLSLGSRLLRRHKQKIIRPASKRTPTTPPTTPPMMASLLDLLPPSGTDVLPGITRVGVLVA